MRTSDHLALIRKWLWLPILLGVTAAASAAVVTYTLPPTYQATTTLQVSPAQLGVQAGYNLPPDQTASLDAQLMTSRSALQKVITDLNLSSSAESLSSAVTTITQQGSTLIKLRVEYRDPSMAFMIANTLAKDFIAANLADQQHQIETSRQTLQVQIADLEKQMSSEANQIAVLQGKPRPSANDRIQLNFLEQQQASHSFTYTSLLKTYDGLNINQVPYQVSIADPAVAPQQPTHQSRLTKVALAGIAGVIAALAGIYMFLTPTVSPIEHRRLTAVR